MRLLAPPDRQSGLKRSALLVIAVLAGGLTACDDWPGQVGWRPGAPQSPAVDATLAAGMDAARGGSVPSSGSAPTPWWPGVQPGGAVAALTDVKKAVLRVEAQGSFMDPKDGMRFNEAGSGSGFLIDPSGLAVTNNHVVTGAAFLKVWIGNAPEAHSARVVAVNECSDLALIDVEGDGFAYLTWHAGDIPAGLDVYAAGFPLGDPEFTLTRGIVSKERASGDTQWASVGSVIEHDATVLPGNSGGPLVTGQGQVVAVTYADNTETRQHFAIARDEAIPALLALKAGRDVASIGLNGMAVQNGEGETGVWVASVASGSPADRAGLKPGDVVTKLEGLRLASDGTMKDYCEVLRSHTVTDTLAVEVIRATAEGLMEGQINGSGPLEPAFAFAADLGARTATGARGATKYPTFTTQADVTGRLSLEVPDVWSDLESGPWLIDGRPVGVQLTASSDLAAFEAGYGTAGVFFGASRALAEKYDPASLIEFDKGSLAVGACRYEGRKDYEDVYYKGVYDLYQACGGGPSGLVVLAARPENESVLLLLVVKVKTDADLDALDRILGSFQLVGDLPSEADLAAGTAFTPSLTAPDSTTTTLPASPGSESAPTAIAGPSETDEADSSSNPAATAGPPPTTPAPAP